MEITSLNKDRKRRKTSVDLNTMVYGKVPPQAKELEGRLRSKHDEMKIIKKELKVKQKTLGTYEYLMRLPVEEE